MKKLFTLILALLFILTACAPAAVEQAPTPEETPEPTVEATPEPTEKADKPTVILISIEGLRVVNFDNSILIDSVIEDYCNVNGFNCLHWDLSNGYGSCLEEYERLLKTEREIVTVYQGIAIEDFVNIGNEYGAETILFDCNPSYYADILPAKHYISYDKEAFYEYICTEQAKVCDGKSALLFESGTISGAGTTVDKLLDETMKVLAEEYDLEKTEKIIVGVDSDAYDINKEENQQKFWERYFENADIDVEQICLFSLMADDAWYLDQLYKLGLTDEQIFHLDYGIANEANIKKMTDGKSDVFYGYTEEAMHKLLISTIDRIFAGETVEERLYVEPIILTSKEEAQAYYEEHFV